MRLRTLPLSLAGVSLGLMLAASDYIIRPWVAFFTLLTTVFLQILSNVSNELGDYLHGTDREADRQGPAYTLSKGLLTEKDFKVGNGGFSLRRVSSHLRATEQLEEVIRAHLSRHSHYSNEDLFFALEVNRHGMNFSYPDYRHALRFSFDKYPRLCYWENRFRLPFGCHAWYKEKMRKFWFPIILGHKSGLEQ